MFCSTGNYRKLGSRKYHAWIVEENSFRTEDLLLFVSRAGFAMDWDHLFDRIREEMEKERKRRRKKERRERMIKESRSVLWSLVQFTSALLVLKWILELVWPSEDE